MKVSKIRNRRGNGQQALLYKVTNGEAEALKYYLRT